MVVQKCLGAIDGQISKLVGSTKGTVSLIKKKLLELSNLKPRDPVILALCTQELFKKPWIKLKEKLKKKKAKIREEKSKALTIDKFTFYVNHQN